MFNRPIEVMIVEDSQVARDLLERVLNSAEGLHVAGCASCGAEALTLLPKFDPDVVTMDIHMGGGLDGYETTRRIMESRPVPIVIVSATYDATDVMQTFRALEAGAVGMTEKPPGLHAPDHARAARALTEMVKAMASVRLVKRWPRSRMAPDGPEAPELPSKPAKSISMVAIGASTGGPPVLAQILDGLPKPLAVPVLIVQHIATGFVKGLADWLRERTGLAVRVAVHGERAQPGVVYLAPDNVQMRVAPGGVIICAEEQLEGGLRPAVSVLFRSVAELFGGESIGILLTGMGSDGAAELKVMRDCGAVTFAQDRQSCTVYGMPAVAARLRAAVYILSPDRIADTVSSLLRTRGSTSIS